MHTSKDCFFCSCQQNQHHAAPPQLLTSLPASNWQDSSLLGASEHLERPTYGITSFDTICLVRWMYVRTQNAKSYRCHDNIHYSALAMNSANAFPGRNGTHFAKNEMSS